MNVREDREGSYIAGRWKGRGEGRVREELHSREDIERESRKRKKAKRKIHSWEEMCKGGYRT